MWFLNDANPPHHASTHEEGRNSVGDPLFGVRHQSDHRRAKRFKGSPMVNWGSREILIDFVCAHTDPIVNSNRTVQRSLTDRAPVNGTLTRALPASLSIPALTDSHGPNRPDSVNMTNVVRRMPKFAAPSHVTDFGVLPAGFEPALTV